MSVAQSLTHSAIVSAGGNTKNANFEISYSIGQVFTATLSNANFTLTQGFQQPNSSLSISVIADSNGTCSPSGLVGISQGGSQTITFTPNSGFWVDSVIVNGVHVPTASSYTFNNVTSNQSIRVTYRSLAAALATANICANDTIVSTVNLPAQSLVRATTYYSNIYLFNQNNTSNAYKYNVNDRKYTAIANKPTACIECGVAEANGKVYCFNTNGTSEAYDIATNAWQNQTNQPSASSSSLYAASINNKIYVLGTNNNQNTFYQYNPQSNSFSVLANPISSNSQSRLVAFNNKLYKIGGTDNNNQPTASVEVYNPSNNTWTAMPDLPVALTQVGATYYDNKLYVFGGKQANSTNSSKVYVFDFTSNAWYAESNTQNTNRTNIEAKTANGLVYLFGGTDTTNTTTNQAQRYFCKDQLCTCKWAEYVCNGVSSDVPCPTSSLYRPGTVFCNGYATKVVDVTNPITGKTWMDRNLGAQRAATSSTDVESFGDLYQWGRGADGHQCRNSGTTSTLSSSDQPNHANFILTTNIPYDWRGAQNDNLWKGVNGTNNPCPRGYRLPTNLELDAERTSWTQNNSIGALNSPLKLPMPGLRNDADGSLKEVGGDGRYWSSSVGAPYVSYLNFFSGDASVNVNRLRAHGFSVRCLKD
jgi:N-acetylneuraminic acid mutarotase